MAVWSLWAACGTQWRTSGFGLIGLDYPAVDWVAARLGMKVSPGMLGKLQALECRVLENQIHSEDSRE